MIKSRVARRAIFGCDESANVGFSDENGNVAIAIFKRIRQCRCSAFDFGLSNECFILYSVRFLCCLSNGCFLPKLLVRRDKAPPIYRFYSYFFERCFCLNMCVLDK